MDCMRINCAHDDAPTWERMIRHLKRANQELQRSCRLSMDIAGPKLRTASLEPGPPVIKIKPHRDALGNVTMPALVGHRRADGADGGLPLARADADARCGSARRSVRPGHDNRIRRRTRPRRAPLRIRELSGGGIVAELESNGVHRVRNRVLRFATAQSRESRRVVNVPATAPPLLLDERRYAAAHAGVDSGPGGVRRRSRQGPRSRPALASRCRRYSGTCSPERPSGSTTASSGVSCGPSSPIAIVVDITQARPDGGRLAAGKGHQPSRHESADSGADRRRIWTISRSSRGTRTWSGIHSFAMPRIFSRCNGISRTSRPMRLGIILKIETRQAFAELPEAAARVHAGRPVRRDDCARRSGGRMRVRADGRSSGRDPVDLRGRAHAGHLGDAGAGVAGEDRACRRAPK